MKCRQIQLRETETSLYILEQGDICYSTIYHRHNKWCEDVFLFTYLPTYLSTNLI